MGLQEIEDPVDTAGRVRPRGVVLELCRAEKIKSREARMRPDELKLSEGVFVSLSSWGVVEAVSLDGVALQRSDLVETIRVAYEKLVTAETR